MLTPSQSPVAALRAGSSPSGNSRKPSGPRPITGSMSYKKASASASDPIKKTRFRGSPNQIDSDDGMGEEERFDNVVTKW